MPQAAKVGRNDGLLASTAEKVAALATSKSVDEVSSAVDDLAGAVRNVTSSLERYGTASTEVLRRVGALEEVSRPAVWLADCIVRLTAVNSAFGRFAARAP